MSSLKDQIINKVDNIYDTKQAIKRAIEDKGQTIEDDLSFYSYADKIRQITAMEGVVKLFETEEEMHSDSTAKEGDLAVVYGQQTKNMTVTDKPQYLIFPETVTLPQEITSRYMCIFISDSDTIMRDIEIELTNNSFKLNCGGSNVNFEVRYTSTDGINYTRNKFESGDGQTLTNPVDLTVPIKVYYEEQWNDMLGYFMQINSHYFGGLYEYQTGEDKDKLLFVSDIFADEDSFGHSTTISQYVTRQFINSGVFDKVLNNLPDNTVLNSLLVVTDYTYGYDNQDIKNIQCFAFTSPTAVDNLNKNTLYACDVFANGPSGTNQSYVMFKAGYEADDTTTDFKMYRWYFNEDEECILEEITDLSTFVWQKTDNTKYNKLCYSTPLNSYWDLYTIQYKNNEFDFYPFQSQPYNGYGSHDIGLSFYEYKEYRIADNQYNLDNSNQLLPDVKAYGKNGNITGDKSVYSNLNYKEMFETITKSNLFKSNYFTVKNNYNNSMCFNTIIPNYEDCAVVTRDITNLLPEKVVNAITDNGQPSVDIYNPRVERTNSYYIIYSNNIIYIINNNYELIEEYNLPITNKGEVDISCCEINDKLYIVVENGRGIYELEMFLLVYDGVDISIHQIFSQDDTYSNYLYIIGDSDNIYISLSLKNIYNIYKLNMDTYSLSQVFSIEYDGSSNGMDKVLTTQDSNYFYYKITTRTGRLQSSPSDLGILSFQLVSIDKKTGEVNSESVDGESVGQVVTLFSSSNNTYICYPNEGVYKLNGLSKTQVFEFNNNQIIDGGKESNIVTYCDSTETNFLHIPCSGMKFEYESNYYHNIVNYTTNKELESGDCQLFGYLMFMTTSYIPNHLNATTYYMDDNCVKQYFYSLHNSKIPYIYEQEILFNKQFIESINSQFLTIPYTNNKSLLLLLETNINDNYNNTLTPEQYLQALEKAKEIKGNKIDINGVVINK